MGVTDQFGLFDIAAHVIPGVVVLAAAGWVVVDVQGGLPPMPGDFIVATVGLVAAYVVGQLCQLLADTDAVRRMLKGPERRKESAESEMLRTWAEPGARPPDAFGPAVCGALRTTLRLDVPTGRTKDDVAAREHRFRTAYAYVMQHGRAERPQMFKAIASFHESMVPASAAVALAALGLCLRSGADPLSTPSLVLGVSVAAMALFRRAYNAFDKRFARSVYYAFYALAAKEGKLAASRALPVQEPLRTEPPASR